MSVPNPCSTPQPQNNSKPTPKAPKQSLPTFILDKSNVQQLLKDNELIKKTIKNITAVHKFIIQNTHPLSSKINILKAFTKQAQPFLIIPLDILSVNNGKNIEFYVKACETAIFKLCEDNLMLTCMVKNVAVTVPMTLIVGYKTTQQLQTKEVLLEVLKTRISIKSKVCLNLQKADTITGMYKRIYFDLSSPVALNYVINITRNINPTILNLAENNIETIKKWKKAVHFESIDLSFNQIKSFDDLGPILRLDLKEIDLRGNPVCSEFASKTDYLLRVKELFPSVIKIDSSPINSIELEIEENYFPTSLDAEYLVDQFMEHYFTLYDHPKKRRYLQDIYHRNACFTLTSTIVDESGPSPASQRYKHHAHNLLQMNSPTDFSIGPSEIIRKICYLPHVEHDPRSFAVDILHYAENKSIMFIIHGIFREMMKTTTATPVLYSFSRTFILMAGAGGEFQIINDMLFVSNKKVETLPSIRPFKKMFYYDEFIEINRRIPVARSKEEKDGFIAIFIELTTLHVKDATDFLEKSKWNMKEALESFVHEHRFDQIDSECFIQNEVWQMIENVLFTIIRPGMSKTKLGKVLENMKTLNMAGQFTKPNAVSKQDWRKQLIALKQQITKEN